MNVVAIGAHPDDIELGAGGSLALHHRRGDAVRFIVLTDGGELSEPSQRRREAKEAAKILNIDDIHFLGYEDTRIPYNDEIIKRLNKHLNEFDTDRVYIHTEEDTHQDHRRASLASVAASRNINEVLAFESPSTRSSFNPEYYNKLTEGVLEQKIQAIRAHKSQCKKKYLEAEAMKGLARFRGRQANTRYAESYQVIRIKENNLEHQQTARR